MLGSVELLADKTIYVKENVKTGNIHATGYIYSGANPATQTVTDIDGVRNLKSGDVYGSQVWSAVYNDYAEHFRIKKDMVGDIKPGHILAVDSSDPNYFTLADKQKYDSCRHCIRKSCILCRR